MMADDDLVVTDGGPGLCLVRTDAVHLGCDFVDEWQHDAEWQVAVLTEDVFADGVAVVDEVAAEDCREVEVETVG